MDVSLLCIFFEYYSNLAVIKRMTSFRLHFIAFALNKNEIARQLALRENVPVLFL